MMKAMWFGTTDLSTSSKYGQQSRLLLRVKYSNPYAFIGDFDRMITLSQQENLNDISQITLNVSNLFRSLADKKVVREVEWASQNDLRCVRDTMQGSFDELINTWAMETNVPLVSLVSKWQKEEKVERLERS
jgi:hypothetical protein